MAYALIPMKQLHLAKERLAPALDAPLRRQLVLAMLEDVFEAASASPSVFEKGVATRDSDVIALASSHGAELFSGAGNLNEALTAAIRGLAERGVPRVVILAGDIALATPEDIEAVVSAPAEVALAAAADGGTNALAMPPGAIPLRYGPDSAARHLAAAHEAGLHALRLDLPRLAFDVDTPEAFARLRDAVDSPTPPGPHTSALLRSHGLVAPAS